MLQIAHIRWIDPLSGHDTVCHLRVDGDAITPVDSLDANRPAVDGQGLWLLPGLVDLGHELLPPGVAEGCDMASELRAARACGLAQVCVAPQTQPLVDSGAAVQWIEHHAGSPRGAELHLLGALTQGLDGTQLSNMAALRAAGCVGLSQGRASLPEAGVLRQCLRYAADLGITVHLTPQLPALYHGCVHDGDLATALGLEGVPVAAETAGTALLLALAEDTGCAVHLSNLSSGAAAQMVAQARERGLPVSADVAIWHLVYDHTAVAGYDSRFHLWPPLRTARDREVLRTLLREGAISAICTQHRALDADAKFGPFAETRAGANGIDGYLALLLRLVTDAGLSPLELAARTSLEPARILGLNPERATRQWLLLDPEHDWQLDPGNRRSAGGHSPLMGESLRGAPAGWLAGGELELFDSWKARHGV